MQAALPARGRPRNEHIDAAVLQATASTLDEIGYRGVAIEDVARRAGVSKSAIYRRWPNRRRLVLAVLEDRLGRIEPPDSGCTLCDLHECLVLVTQAFCRLGAGTLAQLAADGAGDPDLHDELIEVVFEPPRRAVHRTLFEARRRGDLRDDVDLPLTVDVLSSLTFYGLLLGRDPMEPDEIETVVTTMLRGIAADADLLLREYVRHERHESAP
ncbi:TetR/AcrR family transcriptional regulator [Glycomyces harbinensis]|uniref:Transcriptional regulator, TetR family n=1 Tax=Glycomyces harbinensis TaxID=58114 RepID=A0A1G7C7X6_9ACTN|nr:TetR/AcrR family transcriptional regulator [Glycomyces harbinensis]SDE35419.1 transcriptional regulator, TetR family [Glycomyces harbinensis]